MADAALKLARRALASGGPNSNTDALSVLMYYVERESQVAQDTRVWAAMLYLYGQMGDRQGCDECQKRIDQLRSEVKVTPRKDVPTQVVDGGSRRQPTVQESDTVHHRVEEALKRSRAAREKGKVLFDDSFECTASVDKNFNFPAWKSRLHCKQNLFSSSFVA